MNRIPTLAFPLAAAVAMTPVLHADNEPFRASALAADDIGGGRLQAPDAHRPMPAIDDDIYHLFNRAPRERLRPIAPEPHPYTTDPGWVQIEISPLNFTYGRDGDERVRAFDVPVLFKIGLLDNVDIQIGFDAFVWEEVRDRQTRERDRDRGFGDTFLASKINLWGNDGGDSALAVKPYLIIPTARHDLGPGGVEGGVMVPTFWELGDDWAIEVAPWAAAVRNTDDDGYVAEFGQLTVLSRDLFGDVSGFVEFESIITTERGTSWEGVVGTGLTWDVTDDTVIEAGVGFGVTSAADRFNVYISLVQRF
jgi:hypothetical protein